MDVNEKIVEQYIKLVKKWFYMTDVVFKVENGWSNFDLLAYDHKENVFYDIEVKYRSAYKLPKKESKSHEKLIEQLVRPERQKALLEIIGSDKNIKKMLITTKSCLGEDGFNQNYITAKLQERGYCCEILYFDDIIQQLCDVVPVKGRHNTEVTQVIRLLKKMPINKDSRKKTAKKQRK